jgi:hypothetical protein
MAMVQKMFDEWDNGRRGLCRAFGLPKPSPRKNIKRIENCITLTCMNAVAQVFFFKQTAYKYDSATLDESGLPKKFDVRMLWDVLQILQPTPEIIHHAWTMGLEYSIGTSAMGLNSMTILTETFLGPIGSLLRKQTVIDKNLEDFCEDANSLRSMQDEHKNAQANDKDTFTKSKDKKAPRPPNFSQPKPGAKRVSEFDPLLFDRNSRITDQQALHLCTMLQRKRESRCEYMHKCSRSSMGTVWINNPERHVESIMDTDPTSHGRHDDPTLPSEERGRRMFLRGEDTPGTTDKGIFLGYHRERARKFPGPTFCKLDHTVPESKKWCPYCMYDQQLNATSDATKRAAIPTRPPGERPTISYHTSAIWPDVVELTLYYKPQTLINWACSEIALIEPPGLSRLGTRPEIQYSTWGSGQGGEKRYNTAWLQMMESGCDSWFNFANFVRHHSKNRTMAQFDIHLDGLKDCFYLMSTRDNARPIREEPLVSGKFKSCMENASGTTDFIAVETFTVKPKLPWLPESRGQINKKFQMPPRHPDSLVEDTILQRTLDRYIYGNSLQPLSCFISSNVANTAPVRLFNETLQASHSALHDHMLLVTESSLLCSTIPGLKNMQEKFCHNQTGPDGFGMTASSTRKRPQEEPAEVIEGNFMLPYSYDLIQMALSIHMSKRIYDDMGENQLKTTIAHHGVNLGFDQTFDELPQLTFKFLGYSETNRQTISVKLPSKRRDDDDYIEAGDPGFEECDVSAEHVSRSLGRHATGQDVEKYIQRRQGSRSMRGVSGDLFAMSTWFNHSLATLEERGLIMGSPGEIAVSALANMQSCISARIVELASQKGIDNFGKLKISKATPGTYAALDKRTREEAKKMNTETKRKRQIGKTNITASSVDIILTPGIAVALSNSAQTSRTSSRSQTSGATSGLFGNASASSDCGFVPIAANIASSGAGAASSNLMDVDQLVPDGAMRDTRERMHNP